MSGLLLDLLIRNSSTLVLCLRLFCVCCTVGVVESLFCPSTTSLVCNGAVFARRSTCDWKRLARFLPADLSLGSCLFMSSLDELEALDEVEELKEVEALLQEPDPESIEFLQH
jgi:hypothetical protein